MGMLTIEDRMRKAIGVSNQKLWGLVLNVRETDNIRPLVKMICSATNVQNILAVSYVL